MSERKEEDQNGTDDVGDSDDEDDDVGDSDDDDDETDDDENGNDEGSAQNGRGPFVMS